RIQLEGRDRDGQRVTRKAVYDLDRFPAYREGYFGFRMVGTHHIYRNFRAYALDPDKREEVRVASVKAFREAVTKSDQRIVMAPGTYVVSDLLDSTTVFNLSGSDNYIDLSGVTIRVPLSTLRQMTSRGAHGRAVYKLTGNNIALKGGTFENTYPDGMTRVTDFGSYNQNPQHYPPRGVTEMSVRGHDIKIIACTLTVRGSFPYGYGNMYGIGAGNVVGLKKHCGIQITGNRAIIDGCNIKMEAFGHAIFVQGSDRTTVRNTVIEGTVRPSNDCYNEKNAGDLARRFNYRLQWPEKVKGLPIPRDHMLNCTEDGIRAYKGAGHMIVENCVVKKTRGGIKLYMAKSARVSNCQVLDCVVQGYSVPSGGVISNSSGNAAYGPLLYVHFDSHSNQRIDLKVLPSPHSLGDHPLAAIRGRGHSIKFTESGSAMPKTLRPIIVGYPMRFDFLCVDYPDVPKGYEENFAKYSPRTYQASGITINNGTAHPVILGKLSAGNTVTSVGPVRDHGANNSTTVSRQPQWY
ncbi:MAG: right-handed parallel beta-helix repeat-containing protein, partial [Phycisphaerae bacterium]